MTMKLAIIGASYLQHPLVEKAKDMGLETHVFAWKEGNVVENISDYYYDISILEKESILIKCREIGIDGIISIGSDLAMHAVNYVAREMNLVGNTLECNYLSTDKFAMREALYIAGINSPRFLLVTDSKEIPLDKLSFPVIVKPTDRSGSRGISKVESNEETKDAIEVALKESISKRVIIEEFITGKEFSVESFSRRGKHQVLAVTEKVTSGAPHFVELEHHQPAKLSLIQIKLIESTVSMALEALKIENGASHAEVLLTEDNNVFCVEVGARMGGDFIGSHLVKLSTGIDYLKLVVEASLNMETNIEVQKENSFAGIYFLTPDRMWVKEVIELNPSFVVESNAAEKLQLVGKSSADRSGYFIYESSQGKVDMQKSKNCS